MQLSGASGGSPAVLSSSAAASTPIFTGSSAVAVLFFALAFAARLALPRGSSASASRPAALAFSMVQAPRCQ